MVTRRQALQAMIALPLAAKPAAPPRRPPSALGYLPWWMAQGWKAMPLAALERVVLFDASITPEGGMLERDWHNRATGFSSGAAPIELALTLFGEAHFDSLFAPAARRERLLEEAMRQLKQNFLVGLHLDIEGYAEPRPAAVAGFRHWLGELDRERRKLGKSLSAFFPASDSFTPYDREAAQRMDYWVAQLYDAHWPDSNTTGALVTRDPANPASVPRALARLHSLGVSPAAILLSVPLYGWEWPADSEHPGAATRGRARLITYTETPIELMPNDRLSASTLAREHGLRRDREDSPYYAYREGMYWRQGWFEDLRSLTRKFAPERAQQYGGLAFFPLGYDDNAIVEPLLRWWRSPR